MSHFDNLVKANTEKSHCIRCTRKIHFHPEQGWACEKCEEELFLLELKKGEEKNGGENP